MSDSGVAYIPPPPQPPSKDPCIKDIEDYNVKSEAVRLQTFHNWPDEFIDKNDLAAAGFYFTGFKDIVCCAFCEVQLGQWKENDIPSEEHKQWSPACPFIHGLSVGNEKLNRSRDVCGFSTGKRLCLYLFRCMCIFFIFPSVIHSLFFTDKEPSKEKPNKSRGPVYPEYKTVETRLKTFQWPSDIHCLAVSGFFNSG